VRFCQQTEPIFRPDPAHGIAQIKPPELGILEKQIQRGQAVILPITPETRGHETHSLPTIWKQHLADLLQRSGQVAPK